MNKPIHFVFLLVLSLAGCASQGSLDTVRRDVDSVKTRLFTIEKDVGGVRNESKEEIGSIQKNLKNDLAAVRKISADIQASIDSSKTDMQALNGKLDDISIAIRKPVEDLARYREDADKRILAMEDRIVKLQSALDELIKQKAEQPPPAKELPPTPDSVYMNGLETFKAGNVAASRDIFTHFLELYPEHELAANAHYWVGETYYSEKNYEQAVLAFQEVIKNYPKKEKVPAAMLKQSMAFRAIKDVKSARYVLKKLVDGYPKSDEAKKAKELLKELR